MIKTIGVFLQEQLLRMRWLNQLVGNLLQAIGIDLESRMGASVQFFIYDIIKIFILLSVLIFSISYIQSFFPPERTKKILGRFHGIGANTLAALLGTVTPFCSCSSIPLFIGFTSAGLPLGVTFSFLISSPLVDLGSLVMLTGSFGSKVALAYVLVGLVLAVLGGTLIERLHLENDVEEFIRNAGRVDLESPQMSVRDRLSYAKTQVASTVRKVAPYVLVGVAIGALIHNFIPQAFVEELAQKLSSAAAGVIVEYKGISVADDTLLRRKLREAGVDYAVVKNTMLGRAAAKAGLEGLDDVLKGTTALAVSAEDPVSAAKILCEQAKNDENFKVKAGFLDGAVIDVARVNELAKLPSREGLISMLLSVLNGPIRGLAVALNAIAEKQGEGEAAPAAE